ncbi:PREDICTED: uncharacterized protein LOC105561574 isoform X1 [Vollenhovia emeryi]|uniref:uncharacterized protein LOC105561574 isoform X1 n=1 Tax=Vollenhovia emeryi TaxID=411798 RepID=UPI0005F403B0|nr:PREDICTED: uncharacterized protein LOC105561574 isoform X1 [Vollenhovia emeryi]
MEKIPITPQMLHISVKALQKFQLFVKLKDLRDYIQRHYPVETDVKALERELEEKLKYAVYVGLLAKHEDDQYYIPTLREETNAATTAFSAFSEIYKNMEKIPITPQMLHIRESISKISTICKIKRFKRLHPKALSGGNRCQSSRARIRGEIKVCCLRRIAR